MKKTELYGPDGLYGRITEAIGIAVRLTSDADPVTVSRAWIHVSRIEERIVKHPDAERTDIAVAQRGAILAAQKAKAHRRAKNLLRRYLAEDIPDDWKRGLEQSFLENDTK